MYVDGFVLPIPDKNLAAYRRMARLAARVWLDHGALHYVESRGDDVRPGKLTSFPQAVKLKPGETVWFSWIVYKSRKHRDAVLNKVMSDPRLISSMDPAAMPFDGRRMFWGGFKVEIEARPTASREGKARAGASARTGSGQAARSAGSGAGKPSAKRSAKRSGKRSGKRTGKRAA